MLTRGGRPPLDVTGKTVILVDDGLAAGASMLVARHGAARLQPPRRSSLRSPLPRSRRAGTSPVWSTTWCARRCPPLLDQRAASPRHVKLLTYLAISKASSRLAPDGWPLPKFGPNSRYGPTADATSA